MGRLISAVERGDAATLDPARVPAPLSARVVGITGPPGAGKSSLLGALVTIYRRQHRRVGVLAVDPSSPVSGGAVLGDRIRMGRHAADEGVFIRSMGSRGRTDGISPAVRDSARILAGSGYDPVLVETVGVGQAELGIVECCDLRVLVLAPSWGDYVQAAKAGLVEVVDLIVVNKADLPGADALVSELEQAVEREAGRPVRVVSSVANAGEGGVEAAHAAIEAAWSALAPDGLVQRRVEATLIELLNRVRAGFAAGPLRRVTDTGTARCLAEAVCRGETSPAEAAATLLREALGAPAPGNPQCP